jgi:hypothetical protein
MPLVRDVADVGIGLKDGLDDIAFDEFTFRWTLLLMVL